MTTKHHRPCVVIAILLIAATTLLAQPDQSASERTKAFQLIQENRYTEALPLLEKLASATPRDADIQRNLGFALLGQAKNTPDAAAAKQLRARAHTAFTKARENGDDSPLVLGMIQSVAADGGEDATFSNQKQAEGLMQKGEAAFTTGKLDEALKFYQEALKLDPNLYYAALFSGDVYTNKEMYAEAESWYQKAIAIDPYIETAYRYSATPLMKQRKYQEARDRYVEAWITEPYSQFAIQGIVQWGEVTGTDLAHPSIEPPKTATADGKQNSKSTVDPSADDGSSAWAAYAATREDWKKSKFAAAYPREQAYRHSLAEEADALRSVVSKARTLKVKNLNEQIATIERLDKDGLLEAFVLLAMPDNGIAKDHAAYLRSNRDKLRQYVLKYVIRSKQN